MATAATKSTIRTRATPRQSGPSGALSLRPYSACCACQVCCCANALMFFSLQAAIHTEKCWNTPHTAAWVARTGRGTTDLPKRRAVGPMGAPKAHCIILFVPRVVRVYGERGANVSARTLMYASDVLNAPAHSGSGAASPSLRLACKKA